MKKSKPQSPEEFYLGLLTRGARKPFQMSSPYDENLRKVIQVLAENIQDFIRSNLRTDPQLQTEEIASLFQPGRVVVATIPQATVQAMTVWIDPVHAIAVNHGLMLFMYRVARALAPHIITRSATDPPAPPESEAVSIIATLIDWMASPARAPLLEDWPTGQREIRTAENIAVAGERFVVSHEMAHIMRQHLIVDSGKVDTSKMTLEDLDDRPYDQEIEADIIGASLAIDSMFPQKLDPRAGFVGIAMFLHSLHLAEAVGAIVPDAKHPPADLRLNILWQSLPRRYGPDFAVLTSWANDLTHLVTRVGNSALAERNKRRDKAVRYMDRIFLTYPATQGPGRNLSLDNAMLNETLELMRTAPSAVLDAVAENLMNADEFRALASAAASPDQLYRDDRGRRHSIALFLGRYMPQSVRPVLGIEAATLMSPGAKN
jgi:hypothetical protein